MPPNSGECSGVCNSSIEKLSRFSFFLVLSLVEFALITTRFWIHTMAA
jgi:hypothetical protein